MVKKNIISQLVIQDGYHSQDVALRYTVTHNLSATRSYTYGLSVEVTTYNTKFCSLTSHCINGSQLAQMKK